jgi:hypothetical protein
MAPYRGVGSSISEEDNEEVVSELFDEPATNGNNNNNRGSSSSGNNKWRDRIRRVLESPIVRGTATAALFLLLSWMAIRRHRRLLLSNHPPPQQKQQRRIKQPYEDAVSVPLSLLIQMVQEGRLEKILLSTSRIFFRGEGNAAAAPSSSSSSSTAWSKIDLPNNSALQNRIYALLARSKADISTIAEPTDYMSHLTTGGIALVPFVYLALVYRMMNRQFGGEDSTGATNGVVRGNQHTVTFRDVAGIDAVVEEVREVVDYLKDPSRYHQVGATTPSGVLVRCRVLCCCCCCCCCSISQTGCLLYFSCMARLVCPETMSLDFPSNDSWYLCVHLQQQERARHYWRRR